MSAHVLGGWAGFVDALIPRSVKLTREKLGYERVATMFQSMDVFSQSSDEVLKQAFSENGVEVLTTETFESGDMDLYEQFSRIAALNPDAIYNPAILIVRDGKFEVFE